MTKETSLDRVTETLAAVYPDRWSIARTDAKALRRASMTLHRWAEAECGDGNDWASWAIERDENTGKAYRVIYPHNGDTRRIRIPDRQTGARKRASSILARYGFAPYFQTDPRGCALYIIRPGDVPSGESVEAFYTRGVAVY